MSDLLANLHNADSGVWKDEPIAPAPEPEAPAETPEPVAETVEAELEVQPAQVEAAPESEAPAPVDDERRVPLKALHEERSKRAELERRLAELEQRLYQPQQQPAEQQEEPDPETDPIGALKYAREQLRAMREAQERQTVEGQLASAYTAAAQEFQAEAPDFKDAYQYALNSRAAELQALGFAPQQIMQSLRQEEMQLVATAMQNRVNPAEAIYNFAKARGYGSRPAQAPAPVAAAPKAPDPALQKARQAVAATAAAGAKPPKGELTVEDLASLKGAAFDSAFNKLFGKPEGSLFRN